MSCKMDCLELTEILKKGEDSNTQFKEEFKNIDSLGIEITAMANSEGGKILVGISDDGEVIGLEKDYVKKLNQWISNTANQNIEPPVNVITENIIYEDKLVMVINVPLGINKPYAFKRDQFWIKVGADKRRATREELKRLMQASGGLYADEMPIADTGLSDIDLFLFRKFYEQEYGEKIEESKVPVDRILTNLKLLKDTNLTLSGLLLFGDKPQRIKPQFSIKAVAFVGNDISENEYLDSENLEGILVEQFKNTMGFLKRNLKKIQSGQNFNYPGKWEIPEAALEEAVVNAIIHRDYFISSSIRIFIFDNRVEIISPGILPNTVTIESIKLGIQLARNPILLSFVPKLKIPYKGIGSGIKRMIYECKMVNIPEPEFNEDRITSEFKVIFRRI